MDVEKIGALLRALELGSLSAAAEGMFTPGTYEQTELLLSLPEPERVWLRLEVSILMHVFPQLHLHPWQDLRL